MDLREIQDIVKNVLYDEPLVHTELIGFTHAGISINTVGYSVPIFYPRWRVVAVGFGVITGGVSTENPEVEFGIKHSNIAETDTDFFGSVLQDATANKEFDAGDMWIKDDAGFLDVAEETMNVGTPVWDAGGDQLMVWNEMAGILSVTRPNVHVLTIQPFMLVEVENE